MNVEEVSATPTGAAPVSDLGEVARQMPYEVPRVLTWIPQLEVATTYEPSPDTAREVMAPNPLGCVRKGGGRVKLVSWGHSNSARGNVGRRESGDVWGKALA